MGGVDTHLECCLDIVLPQLLQLIDLCGRYLPCTQLTLFAGLLDQPGQKATIGYQWLPLLLIPVHVLERVLGGARLAAEQYNHRIRFGGYEPKHKDIAHSTRITLEYGLAKGTVGVQGHLTMLGTHQMIDDVRTRCAAASIAEPLLAVVAHNYCGRIVYATIFAGMSWQLFHI